LLQTVSGIRCYNLQEFILGVKKCTLTSFVAVGIRSEGNTTKKWRTELWSLLHASAQAYRSVLVKNFLTKNNVTTLEHSPYSPDLSSADVYLFSRLNSSLKGRRFCDAADIIKNEKEELKRLSQNGFQDVSNTLTVVLGYYM